MPLCEKHGEFFREGRTCHSCNQQNIMDWKAGYKANKQKEKKYGSTKKQAIMASDKSEQYDEREKLKAKLQAEWRKKVFPYYKSKGLTDFCWVNRHPFLKGVKNKLYAAHVSHYYAKSHIYQLWTHPVNSGICCYNHNIDKPETVAAMKGMIVEVWGQQRFDDMCGEAEMYLDWINKGVDNKGKLVLKYPSTQWLIDKIEETKKMVIN